MTPKLLPEDQMNRPFELDFNGSSSNRNAGEDEELKGGEEITPELIKASEEPRIAIPIFSENYASSQFCFSELLLGRMVERSLRSRLRESILHKLATLDLAELLLQKEKLEQTKLTSLTEDSFQGNHFQVKRIHSSRTTRFRSNFNDEACNDNIWRLCSIKAQNLYDNETLQLQDKSSACNLNKYKETMPRGGDLDALNQHKRKETAKRVSSSIVSAILFLGISYDIYCYFCRSPMIKIQQVHQEQHGRVSIWPSLLSLLGFMMFVLAVSMMIIFQAPFTRMQRAMLVFWGILMHVRSATSISEMYVPILGIFLMGALLTRKQPYNEDLCCVS